MKKETEEIQENEETEFEKNAESNVENDAKINARKNGEKEFEDLDDKRKFLVFLSYYEIPLKKQEAILESLSDFSLSAALKSEEVKSILTADEFQRLLDGLDERELDGAIKNMLASGTRIVTIFDDDYPQKLVELPERPVLLYARGDLSILNEQCFGMVGTRSPSGYGKIVTEKFATTLAESGLVIVSGLCYGVDEISHRATLKAGGKTVAVIASGFGKIYPSINAALAKEIVESGGLILSEYPPSFVAKKYTFPRRNRIVAGLCDGILITEAGSKSGTLHTKEFALSYGRDIFAVPGNITSSKSELTNLLIKSSQAECALAPEDILDFYGLNAKAKEKKVLSLTFEESEIVKFLEDGEKSFDELAEATKIATSFLSSCLTTLEIRGIVRSLPSQMFALLK